MRNGQPCIVHAVGGLRDTIIDNEDGFHFEGKSVSLQARAFQTRLQEVIALRESEPDRFRDIANNARAKRFLWQASAEQYLTRLYS